MSATPTFRQGHDFWANGVAVRVEAEAFCHDDDQVRRALVDTDGLTPDRKWPAELCSTYLDASGAS